MDDIHRRRGFDRSVPSSTGGCLPTRVEQLCEVDESKPSRRVASCREVEDNLRFHGCEQCVTRGCSTVVEEVGLVDAAVFRLAGRFTDDTTEECEYTGSMEKVETYRSIISISNDKSKDTFVSAHEEEINLAYLE